MEKQPDSSRDAQNREPHLRSVRLTSDFSLPKLSALEIGSYAFAILAMWLVIELKLLGGLLAGLLVYQLIHTIAPVIERHTTSMRARWVAVVLLSIAIVGALTGLTIGIIEHFERTVPNLQSLLDQLMQIVEQTRARTPAGSLTCCPSTSSR